MRHKIGRVLGAMGLVLGLAVFACAQAKVLTILHTNDTHSVMLPIKGEMFPNYSFRPEFHGPGIGLWGFCPFFSDREHAGIARMATLIKRIRAGNDNVLALHSGDVFVGTFEFNKYLGYPELKIMENLYDAMELGNHEFDLGLDTLTGVLSGALAGGAPVALPVLCANVNFSGTPLTSMVQPYIIKTIGGVKVGILGVVTEDKQNYSPDMAALFSGDVEAVARTQAAFLKNDQHCDVVICLSHLGTAADIQMANNVANIDIIVGGHSHDLYKKAMVQNGKIIVQAGAFGEFLGKLKVKVENGLVKLISWTACPASDDVREDPKVRAQLNVLRDGIVRDPRFGPVYSRYIATAFWPIRQMWPQVGPNRDSGLGNLVTDSFRAAAAGAGLPVPVDLAMDVLGYMSADIPAGKVVGSEILRAVPYGYDPATGLGFKIVVVPLPGSLLLGGLEYAADTISLSTDMAIQASGLTYTYDSSKPPVANLGDISRLDPASVRINGEPIDITRVYFVVMSEQVFGFLNTLVAPVIGTSLQSIPTGIFEYNAVRDYMRQKKFVYYRSEGRIKDTAPAMVK